MAPEGGPGLRSAHDRLRARLRETVPALWRRRTDLARRTSARAAGTAVDLALDLDLGAGRSRAAYHPASGTVGGLRLDRSWLAPPDGMPPALRDSNGQETARPAAVARETLATAGAVVPLRVESLRQAVETYRSALAAVRDRGHVAPLVDALRDGRPGVAAAALGIDPAVVDPGADAESADREADAGDRRPEVVRLCAAGVDGVPLHERDLAVVRAADGSRAFVLGADDTPTGFFVHAVDAAGLSPDAALSRRRVHDAMGFDRSLSGDRLDPERGERVRLQGDLRVRRVGDAVAAGLACGAAGETAELDRAAAAHLDRVADTDAVDVSVTVRGVADRTPRFAVRVDDGALSPERRHEVVTALVTASGDAPDPTPGSAAVDGDGGAVSAGGDLPRDVALYRAVERGPLADAARGVYPSAFRRPVDREVARRVIECSVRSALRPRRETLATALSADTGQAVLPVDDHLLVAGAGAVPGDRAREPVTLAVPRSTRLEVVHDEHDPVSVTVAPGVYEVSLLPRGRAATLSG